MAESVQGTTGYVFGIAETSPTNATFQLKDVLTLKPTIAQILNAGTRSTTAGDINFDDVLTLKPTIAREILVARCNYT